MQIFRSMSSIIWVIHGKNTIRAMATACSLLWGGAIMTVAACNAVWPNYGGAFLDCLGSIYPGFPASGTLLSAVVDTMYGMADGAFAGAMLVAERIRKKIEENIFKAYDETLKMTVSIGVSIYPDDATGETALIENADKALYDAKKFGKNIVYEYKR